MTEFITFGTVGDLINPALVWRINLVGVTVSFHVVAPGMIPSDTLKLDFVFPDEDSAIAALADFIVQVESIKLNDIVLDMCSGITANVDLTQGFLKFPGIPAGVKLDRYAAFVIDVAAAVKVRADAL